MPAKRNPRNPPVGLRNPSKQLWRVTLEYLEEMGVWDDIDSAALERYVRAEARSTQARAAVEKEGLTVRGSQGQSVQNPNLKTAREAERDARDYANDLLLTPAARRKHQLEAGAGEAADPLDAALS